MATMVSDVWRQRIGYGIGDFGFNLVWQTVGLYLMFFYTDVVGLEAFQVAPLFLVVGVINGFADIAMGFIIDRTSSRWGKARPYLLWGAVPFAVFSILAFYMPGLGMEGKLIYAYVTFLSFSIAYTFVNIPQTAILVMLTSDPQERTILSSSRMFFSFLGAAVVSAFTLPLVEAFGNGSMAKGFFDTVLAFSIAGMLIILFTFFNVKERVKKFTPKPTVKEALFALKGNHHWYIFAVNIFFMWGAYFCQQAGLVYYFSYYVGKPGMVVVIATISTLVPLAGVIAAPVLSKQMTKRDLFLLSSGIHLCGMIVMIVADQDQAMLIAGAILSAIGFGLRHAIYFSMQADPVDYSEWMSGINVSGVMSALNGFIGKLALAAAGAMSSFLLARGLYIHGKVQPESALFAIRLNYLVIPSALVLLSMAIMCFYDLDKIYPKIRAEIDARL